MTFSVTHEAARVNAYGNGETFHRVVIIASHALQRLKCKSIVYGHR